MDFSLNLWTQVWLNRFDVRSRRKDGEESILTRYERLVKILDDENEQSKAYRKELLGPEIISHANAQYWILATIFELHIQPHVWNTYPVKERGKLIAYQRLRSIEQLLDRHEREQDRRKDAKTGKKQDGKQGMLFGNLRS